MLDQCLRQPPAKRGPSQTVAKRACDFDTDIMPSSLLTVFSTAEFSRWLRASHNGSAYDWTARLLLASVYTVCFFANASLIVQLIAKWKHDSFISNALTIAAASTSALFVGLVAATIITRLQPVRKSEGMAARIAAALGTYLAFGLAMLPRADMPPIILAISSLLLIVGAVMSFAVMHWLGKAFSIMPEARRLVTHGPYGLVRHPLYICEEIAVVGVLIQVISPLAMAMWTLHVVFQFRRMLNEERILAATFPDYDDYARRTPRLIPARWLGKFA
jgi:protein-S-isoprenylcysteine O-methyltransferase Ste14